MSDDETAGSSAAEILALAEEAEAEAAEAEALATAARARARAIKLRRDADRAATTKQKPARKPATKAARAARTTSVAGAKEVTQPAEVEPAEVEPETAEATETRAAETQAADTGMADAREAEPDTLDSTEPDAPDPAEAVATEEAEETEADDDARPTEEVAEAKPVRRLSPRRLGRPRWSTVAAVAAVVVIIAALVGSVHMIMEHRHAAQQRERAGEFVAAAKQGVVTLTSLDFNDAKPGVQRIVDDSTGTFKDDFLKMAGDFVKVVQESKVVSRGTVQAAAVDLDSMKKDSAVVLIACTSEVTNAAGAKQDPRTYRLIVTMTRDGGQLKMSKVEFVP